MKPLRLFFALFLSLDKQYELAHLIHDFKKNFDETMIRWVALEDYHVTLQFQASFDAVKLAALIEQVSIALSMMHPFSLEFGEFEWFPSKRNAKILSLAVYPNDDIDKLSLVIGDVITKQGYSLESRTFRPHLTLARLVKSANLADIASATKPREYDEERMREDDKKIASEFKKMIKDQKVLGPILVDKVYLIKSIPLKSKTNYEILKVFALLKDLSE